MKDYYQTSVDNVDISATVEGYFPNMKNELQNGQSVITVIRFASYHLNSIAWILIVVT